MVYRTQKIILSPHSPPTIHLLTQKAPAILILSPFLQQTRCTSSPVPLYLTAPLPLTLYTQAAKWFVLFLRSLFKCQLIVENCSWLLLTKQQPSQVLTGFVVCFLFCCISGIAYLHCVLYIIYLHYIVYLLLHWLFYHWTLTMVRQTLLSLTPRIKQDTH